MKADCLYGWLYSLPACASTGCKSDADAGAGEQASSGEETAVKQAVAKPDAFTFLDRPAVTGYGALASLDSFKKMATDMMAKFQFLPASVVPAMVDDSIKEQFQVQSSEWLDSSLPIVMLVGDMREQEDTWGWFVFHLQARPYLRRAFWRVPKKIKRGTSSKWWDRWAARPT